MIAEFKTRLMPLFRRSSASTTTNASAKSAASSTASIPQQQQQLQYDEQSTARPRSTRSRSSLLGSPAAARRQKRTSWTQQEGERSNHNNNAQKKLVGQGEVHTSSSPPSPQLLHQQQPQQRQPHVAPTQRQEEHREEGQLSKPISHDSNNFAPAATEHASQDELFSTPEQSPRLSRNKQPTDSVTPEESGVQLRLQGPSPDPDDGTDSSTAGRLPQSLSTQQRPEVYPAASSTAGVVTISREGSGHIPSIRRQSIAHTSQQKLVETLLHTFDQSPTKQQYQQLSSPTLSSPGAVMSRPSDGALMLAGITPNMLHRKLWVKRPGASATLVQINEDDLVDDVRDMILKKYANSLGRSFDSPDVTLRITPRDHSNRGTPQESRQLGPEEHMARTLDVYYPNGQTVSEALVIEVPHRRTPRHSPRVHVPYYQGHDDMRPNETDQGYFPAVIPIATASPHPGSTISLTGSSGSGHPHSIAVLNTGQIPPLPSPGGTRGGNRHHRPKFPRNSTSSPTTLTGNPPQHATVSYTSDAGGTLTLQPPDGSGGIVGTVNSGTHGVRTSAAPNPPPLPTPPLATLPPSQQQQQRVATPPPRVNSPRPMQKTKRTSKKNVNKESTGLPGSFLDGSVPPINVLIVEDNIINLRLLEAFMKRLKVRWSTAMNGRDAVAKWRDGGFHLVLMDIQLPIMNGLDATKEIRRIESVNGVGVFAVKNGRRTEKGGQLEAGEDEDGDNEEKEAADKKDRLKNQELFKSPVIIVALTASSLQSDRHEALAAGCNDFLTKPVNFVWLERKVMEWGCMQALIDFDGWRKWKDVSQNQAKQQSSTSGHASKLSASLSKSKVPPNLKSSSSAILTSPTSANNNTHPNGSNSNNGTVQNNSSSSDSSFATKTERHNSATTNSSTTVSPANPPQDALLALNDQADSTNTIDTLDSIDSTTTTTTNGDDDDDDDELPPPPAIYRNHSIIGAGGVPTMGRQLPLGAGPGTPNPGAGSLSVTTSGMAGNSAGTGAASPSSSMGIGPNPAMMTPGVAGTKTVHRPSPLHSSSSASSPTWRTAGASGRFAGDATENGTGGSGKSSRRGSGGSESGGGGGGGGRRSPRDGSASPKDERDRERERERRRGKKGSLGGLSGVREEGGEVEA